MADHQSLFEAYLNQHDDAAWEQVIDQVWSAIHPVDQRATRIWFAFFPLKLKRALEAAPDPAKLERDLILQGAWKLGDQVDGSAHFLYGHRYWPDVKKAVAVYADATNAPSSLALRVQILDVAGKVATQVKADKSLLTGITAVAFMTLQQVGRELFGQPSAPVGKATSKSPDQIVRGRATDDNPGMFGFLRTIDKRFTVTFDERNRESKFKIVHTQDLTMAAQLDKRPHHLNDPRCKAGEGPIPVECRTAACGTCWVGVLSDASKVAEPTSREINMMNETFCYSGFTGTHDSPIRLACQVRCEGNISIVIPPWNGLLRKLSRLNEPEEETVTTE